MCSASLTRFPALRTRLKLWRAFGYKLKFYGALTAIVLACSRVLSENPDFVSYRVRPVQFAEHPLAGHQWTRPPLLPLAHMGSWCPGRESNPHEEKSPEDFKSWAPVFCRFALQAFTSTYSVAAWRFFPFLALPCPSLPVLPCRLAIIQP